MLNDIHAIIPTPQLQNISGFLLWTTLAPTFSFYTSADTSTHCPVKYTAICNSFSSSHPACFILYTSMSLQLLWSLFKWSTFSALLLQLIPSFTCCLHFFQLKLTLQLYSALTFMSSFIFMINTKTYQSLNWNEASFKLTLELLLL